jgi:hypothetical protein
MKYIFTQYMSCIVGASGGDPRMFGEPSSEGHCVYWIMQGSLQDHHRPHRKRPHQPSLERPDRQCGRSPEHGLSVQRAHA